MLGQIKSRYIFYKLLKIHLRKTDFDLIFQINQTIKDVGLEDQKDTFAKDLSGGQKRKLSVAISLIGDPKVARSVYTCKPIFFNRVREIFARLSRALLSQIFLVTDQYLPYRYMCSCNKKIKGVDRALSQKFVAANQFILG